jgi:VIT1/CCC1 family predicted Fe2+/Mn2+ transporter
VEQRELAESPEVEQAELVQLYVARGVEVGLAREVARQLSQDPQQALVAHAREDLGVDPSDLPSPLLAAATSYLLGATTVLPTVLVSAAPECSLPAPSCPGSRRVPGGGPDHDSCCWAARPPR